jgi:hypothetical protein
MNEIHGTTETENAAPQSPASPELRAQEESILEQDILALHLGRTTQQHGKFLVGFDCIAVAIKNSDERVLEIIQRILNKHKLVAGEDSNGFSAASLYRLKGPIQNLIKRRAKLDCPVTIPYLRKHPHLLELVPRDEMEQLAKDFHTPQALAKELRNGTAEAQLQPRVPAKGKGSQGLVVPLVNAKTVGRQLGLTHKPLAIMAHMLRQARRENLALSPEVLIQLQFYKRAGSLLTREINQILKQHKKEPDFKPLL